MPSLHFALGNKGPERGSEFPEPAGLYITLLCPSGLFGDQILVDLGGGVSNSDRSS